MRYLNVYEMDSKAQAYLNLFGRDSEALSMRTIVAQKLRIERVEFAVLFVIYS